MVHVSLAVETSPGADAVVSPHIPQPSQVMRLRCHSILAKSKTSPAQLGPAWTRWNADAIIGMAAVPLGEAQKAGGT